MLKMLKIGCFMLFSQNFYISDMPQRNPMQFLLSSGENQVIVTSFSHIHSGSQQNLFLFIFQYLENAQNAVFAVLSKITISQVCLKVIQCNFLLNRGESQVIVTSVIHIQSGL